MCNFKLPVFIYNLSNPLKWCFIFAVLYMFDMRFMLSLAILLFGFDTLGRYVEVINKRKIHKLNLELAEKKRQEMLKKEEDKRAIECLNLAKYGLSLGYYSDEKK